MCWGVRQVLTCSEHNKPRYKRVRWLGCPFNQKLGSCTAPHVYVEKDYVSCDHECPTVKNQHAANKRVQPDQVHKANLDAHKASLEIDIVDRTKDHPPSIGGEDTLFHDRENLSPEDDDTATRFQGDYSHNTTHSIQGETKPRARGDYTSETASCMPAARSGILLGHPASGPGPRAINILHNPEPVPQGSNQASASPGGYSKRSLPAIWATAPVQSKHPAVIAMDIYHKDLIKTLQRKLIRVNEYKSTVTKKRSTLIRVLNWLENFILDLAQKATEMLQDVHQTWSVVLADPTNSTNLQKLDKVFKELKSPISLELEDPINWEMRFDDLLNGLRVWIH